jgi:ABC-type multidrug transport system ATPase subunit
VVARELDGDLRLLVLDQPTRGLDVGSIEFIHRQAIKKRDAGTAVLLVSAELDEVLELSDRVAVMYRGQIVAVVDGRTADRNEVGVLMATGMRQEAAIASGAMASEAATADTAIQIEETGTIPPSAATGSGSSTVAPPAPAPPPAAATPPPTAPTAPPTEPPPPAAPDDAPPGGSNP